MKMREVIAKVSDLYRDKQKEVADLYNECMCIKRKISEANRTNGEQITVAEYNGLQKKLKDIEKEIELQTNYCEGISCARELLMDMVFDTEVN